MRGGKSHLITSYYSAGGQRTGMRFDFAGRIYARDQAVSFYFDSAGGDPKTGLLYGLAQSGFGERRTSTYHNADAQVNRVELPIGSWDVQPVQREFSSLHQLTSERFGANTYLDTLFGRTYSRDSVGRITAAQRTIGNKAREFHYDSAGRSTGYAGVTYGPSLCVVGPNGGCGGSPASGSSTGGPQYSYDKVGNRLDDGAATGTANRLLQISGYTYQYDADGNVTRRTGGGVDQYLYWNSINQLDSIWSSNVGMVRFRYDGRGRRIRKQGPTYAWNYHYTGEQLYTETKDDGTVMRTYKYYPGIDNPASVTNWDRTYHFVSDASGNITGAIDEANGAIANQYTYAPYGQLESVGQAFDNPVRFKGRYHDNELNLYENRARYYDPIAGRFLSEDPIGLEGGINQYVFAGNDPINLSDPSGLCVIDPREATLRIWIYFDEEGGRHVGTSLPAICVRGTRFESGESANFGRRRTPVLFLGEGGGGGGGGAAGGWSSPALVDTLVS